MGDSNSCAERASHPLPTSPARGTRLTPRSEDCTMLSIGDTRSTRHCQGTSRREFLRVGSLALLGGMGLPQLMAARAKAASEGRAWKDKSVVLLFLQGGPSHIEF